MVEMPISSLRGKWAQGIKPRDFLWVLKDQIAVCERLGGRGSNHRPIRRQEEIVWVMNNDFDLTISMIAGSHNLDAYKRLGLAHRHWPVIDGEDPTLNLPRIYEQMGIALDHDKRMLMHRVSLDDTVMGFFGGFLIWGGYLENATDTTVMIERLFSKQVGAKGRLIINTIAADPTIRKPSPEEQAARNAARAEAAAAAEAEAAAQANVDADV